MKELLAGFAAEIFRPIVTLLIPGFWAITPWTVWIFLRYSDTWQFANKHRDSSGLVFVVIATAVGMVLENIGGRVENIFYRCHSKDENAAWYDYLALALEPEPIGIRYIRAIVLRLKFELGMASAGVIAILGTVKVQISWELKAVVSFFTIGLILYFVYEGNSSVLELHNTRVALLKRLQPQLMIAESVEAPSRH